ncbi:AMP-binding protein [Variovorax humicola]|uniref:AMP-binding protein n=1 Tax=Variovorax humicola TaxID=1769758 RepID=A0ABU8W360_9BURK
MRHGASPHTVQDGVTVSYMEFAQLTHRVACGLRAAGVAEGDRVAIWSRNDMRMLQAIYGAWRCGAVVVPLNARNAAEENVDLIRRFGCKVLLAQPDVVGLAELTRAAPELGLIVPFDAWSDLQPYAAWLEKQEAHFPDRYFSAEEPAAIFATSGTTGLPKGVVHTHAGLASMSMGYRNVLDISAGVRHLVVGGMTHVAGGIVYATTGLGATQYISHSTRASDILDRIERDHIDMLFVPPTLIYALLDEQLSSPSSRRDLSSLKTLIYAGSSISPARLQQAIEVFGNILVNVYSQTEVLYPITSLSKADHARIATGEEKLLRSAGKPTRTCIVGILDDQMQHVPVGERGEICTRSLSGMLSFFNSPGAVHELRSGGWHHTGDIGVMDEEGFVYIVDRKKDMIVSGGFNVYPAEVETVLSRHADVADSAVVGLPDEKWGERVAAFVVARPGMARDDATLIEHCRSALGSVKAPKEIIWRDELPRNSAGKVLKHILRKEGQTA